ncbi:hypothetical protein PPACK8108_LOCUS24192 [Phakopsora pachyrhizi]|uniref:Uncharacterized protein n=1 Tax=Phakopsora pachyrhizi TaxID=170000 RepID=A0AAV0BRH5_PHAPC|nr:hypothetical protein PPACK8108_LOCUS24192 [Phakopsora pachyrhizi]
MGGNSSRSQSHVAKAVTHSMAQEFLTNNVEPQEVQYTQETQIVIEAPQEDAQESEMNIRQYKLFPTVCANWKTGASIDSVLKRQALPTNKINCRNGNPPEEILREENFLPSMPRTSQNNPFRLLNEDINNQLIYPQLLQNSSARTEESLQWSLGSPPTKNNYFDKDKQAALRRLLNQHRSVGECVKKLVKTAPGKNYCDAFKLGTELNDEMKKTFGLLSGWFEHLEVDDYEPFNCEDSKGKR